MSGGGDAKISNLESAAIAPSEGLGAKDWLLSLAPSLSASESYLYSSVASRKASKPGSRATTRAT